ncbi:AdoMet_MTases domain containing protein [Burkholderiaceae bacterium]|jgi:ubiquinone/menaquinone biosynthesis C-methylase UbiE
MTDEKISFGNGANYEQMMGEWSRLVGANFLNWLNPQKELRWVDVGCGNGAFTEMIIENCAPSLIDGIDPSASQLHFASTRPECKKAKFQIGNAMNLPYPNETFDSAVMALVIFFVPDPGKGISEMVRVVKTGGWVSAYVWDMLGGGFPLAAIQNQMRTMGLTPRVPPSSFISRIDQLQDAWTNAKLHSVQTTKILVNRTFKDFDHYWSNALLDSSVGEDIAAMTSDDRDLLKVAVRNQLPTGVNEQIVISALANAVRGQVF